VQWQRRPAACSEPCPRSCAGSPARCNDGLPCAFLGRIGGSEFAAARPLSHAPVPLGRAPLPETSRVDWAENPEAGLKRERLHKNRPGPKLESVAVPAGGLTATWGGYALARSPESVTGRVLTCPPLPRPLPRVVGQRGNRNDPA